MIIKPKYCSRPDVLHVFVVAPELNGRFTHQRAKQNNAWVNVTVPSFLQQSQVQAQSQISISTWTPSASLSSSHVARRTHKSSPGSSKLCLGLFSVFRSKAADKPLKLFTWGSQTFTVKCQFTCNELMQAYTFRWLTLALAVSQNVNSLGISCQNFLPSLIMQFVHLLTGCRAASHETQYTHWFVHF